MSEATLWVDKVRAYIAVLRPVRAGLRNSVGDEILHATRIALEDAISKYEDALLAADQAIRAIERLESIGFPDIPRIHVSAEVRANLDGNIKEQQAALGVFDVPLGAVSGATEVGDEVPK